MEKRWCTSASALAKSGSLQVRIIGAELVGQEHALVDDGAAGDRDRIIAGQAPLAPLIDRVRDRLAQQIEPPLELGLVLDLLAAADEDLLVHRLGRLDRGAERRVVDRHVAPAEQRHALALDHLGVDVADHLPPVGIARHEQGADRVFARRRQPEAELVGRRGEERMRDLHQDAGAVAGARIGADRAAMLEIAQDRERVLDDLVGFAALDVGDEADPAGAFAQRRIVEALRRRQPVGRRGIDRIRLCRTSDPGLAPPFSITPISNLASCTGVMGRACGAPCAFRGADPRRRPEACSGLWSLAAFSPPAVRRGRVAAHPTGGSAMPDPIAHSPPAKSDCRQANRRQLSRPKSDHGTPGTAYCRGQQAPLGQ